LRFNEPPFRSLADIKGLKVTVMGLGLNGGGLASARFFAAHGATVTVTDKKTEEELAPSIESLRDFPGIRFVLGRHDLSDFSGADVVVKNPGVKLEGNEYLAAARSIESDVSVFLRLSRAPILAVTGSKGKSSTVSALHFGLKELGYTAFLGGNITVSPLAFIAETDETTPVVLELSSWQLADLRGRGLLKPRVAILTLVIPDHQNWYGGMEPYVADKKLIYADQDESCHLLCNADDEWGRVFAKEAKARNVNVHWYSTSPLPVERARGAWLEADGRGFMRDAADDDGHPVGILPKELSVPGNHMRLNLLNAAQALVLFGAKAEAVGPALARYPGIEHRLEFFREKDGVRWYNDSAATVPEAVAAAIASFDRPVVLLTGGTDKNLDFAPLASALSDPRTAPRKIFLLAGTGTDKLIALIRPAGVPFEGPFASLGDLVRAADAAAKAGDVAVFSPGATSFGLFKNEFDRGNKFREAVRGL